MTNPFDTEDGKFHVLVNGEGQHSLWPTFIDVPAGWRIMLNSDTRAACLEYIEANWTDMRPVSLRKFMAENNSGRRTGNTEPGTE